MLIYLGIYDPPEKTLFVSQADVDPRTYGISPDMPLDDYKDLSGAVYGVDCIRPGLIVIWAFASREAVVSEFYEQFFYLEDIKDVSITFAKAPETPI